MYLLSLRLAPSPCSGIAVSGTDQYTVPSVSTQSVTPRTFGLAAWRFAMACGRAGRPLGLVHDDVLPGRELRDRRAARDRRCSGRGSAACRRCGRARRTTAVLRQRKRAAQTGRNRKRGAQPRATSLHQQSGRAASAKSPWQNRRGQPKQGRLALNRVGDMAQYDVVVVGLGAMGSAALLELARRGVRALGIERFAPGHDRGSSHGETRIIRLGYFEHPSYVPLLRRTYELWRELEAAMRAAARAHHRHRRDRPARRRRGGGHARARRAMHGLPHEVLDAAEVMRRFPAFRIPDRLRRRGAARRRLPRRRAVDRGAWSRWPRPRARRCEPARRCARSSRAASGVRVETERGTIDAGTAIVAAGPWVTKLLPDLPVQLRVTRQVHGLVRAARAGAVRGRPLPGVPARKPARRPLRLSAARRRAA